MLCKKHIPFKIQYDIQQRKSKSKKFIQNNRNSVPLIVEPLPDSKISPFQNGKFSIQKSRTITYLKTILLGKIKLEANGGLFLFIGKKMLHQGHVTIGQIYENYHDQDGFLYIHYSETSPF